MYLSKYNIILYDIINNILYIFIYIYIYIYIYNFLNRNKDKDLLKNTNILENESAVSIEIDENTMNRNKQFEFINILSSIFKWISNEFTIEDGSSIIGIKEEMYGTQCNCYDPIYECGFLQLVYINNSMYCKINKYNFIRFKNI